MALSDAEKVAARRYMGYPAYGPGASGFQSWRFFQQFGLMEYRINNLATEEENVVRSVYLTNLATLETGILGSADNLDTAEAAVWKRNPNEVADRTALFDSWRRRLCGFLGLPPGPALGSGEFQIII